MRLAQLLGGSVGPAFGRVTVLLDLRGQGAAATARGVRFVDAVQGLVGHCFAEAIPRNGRIALGKPGIQKITVLDKEQRIDQQRRHRLEAIIVRTG